MKINLLRGGFRAFLMGSAGAFLLFSTLSAWSKPRPPMPPWPEVYLFQWSFDEPLHGDRGTQSLMGSALVESWSGYSLLRQGSANSAVILPMVDTTQWKIAPEEGAVRCWFSPYWSSTSSGLGQGPGHYARLLELVSGSGKDVLVWFSLYASADGNTLYLSTQGPDGPMDSLQTPIQWRAGEWHLITLSYGSAAAMAFPQPWPRQTSGVAEPGPRETRLWIDGILSAIGEALPSIPLVVAPTTGLIVGSDADGKHAAEGQFEQLTTFSFPLGDWDLTSYYESTRRIASLGPVTPAEEEARRTSLLARKATLHNARISFDAIQANFGGELQLDSMEYGTNLWVVSRLDTNNTTFHITVVNAVPNASYDIYFREYLQSTNNTWQRIALRGEQGQTNFALEVFGNCLFIRAADSGDWDRDGVPNDYDPLPTSATVSNLVLTIDFPMNGANLD